MEARVSVRSVVLALVATATLAGAGPSGAARVALLVVKPFPVSEFAARGAVGLLVPGSGAQVSREGALAALERGAVQNSLLGLSPGGRVLVWPGRVPAAVTVYVALPPRGVTANTRRYPIAIVGGGYHGLLFASASRIPGLVGIAAVAPAVVALQAGRRPAISWRSDDDAAAELGRLDRRLRQVGASSPWARVAALCGTALVAALALALRSRLVGRAALLALPLAYAGALALSALGVAGPWPTAVALTALALVGSSAAAALLRGRALGGVLVLLLGGLLLVLVAWPPIAALAVIGPHPGGGSRFYGVSNSVETLLLVPAVVGTALLGARFLVPVGLLALVLVGWSRAGADGGGVIVIGAAFAVLWFRLRDVRATAGRLIGAAAGVVLAGLGLVGIDAAAGGSSHVTHAIGRGPVALAGELGHRLHSSWNAIGSSWVSGVAFVACVLVIAGLALARPRAATVDAIVVAIAVSLLVNDSPGDVSLYGAVCVLAVWSWERVRRSRVFHLD